MNPDGSGQRRYDARMELTPELFEKTEFTERRKGYDIEQVETFLEQTGTALAQLLARVRHTEERAAQAESRLSQTDSVLAEADARVSQADQRAAQAEARTEAAERAAREAGRSAADAAADSARISEEAEVEQAAKTLLMAKRTAEATVNEARGQAQSLLEDSQGRAQRQLSEANAEAAELIRRANEQAEAEFADRRATALDEVSGLEGRRAQLADVITQLESRLAGYRDELSQTADDLLSLADDPSRLGARPNMSIPPDEVLSAVTAEPPMSEERAGDIEQVASVEDASTYADAAPEAPPSPDTGPEAPTASASGESAENRRPADDLPTTTDGDTSQADTAQADSSHGGADPTSATAGYFSGTATALADAPTRVVDTDDAPYVDLTRAGSDQAPSERWGPGSWSEVEADLIQDANAVDDRPTEAVSPTDVQRDRFMEELDSAVNEAVVLDDDDAAMTAFFEGTSDSRTRRFGWRR